jgi:hypothetical protein
LFIIIIEVGEFFFEKNVRRLFFEKKITHGCFNAARKTQKYNYESMSEVPKDGACQRFVASASTGADVGVGVCAECGVAEKEHGTPTG